MQAPEPRPALVFEYDPQTGAVGWKVEGRFPLPPLVNALELAKAVFVGQQLAGAARGRPSGLVLPDGTPAPPGI
jgi:hypothetical protein